MAITNELYQAVKQMQLGDEQGFNYVYSQTYNYVYARAKYIMQNDEDAIDLLQETYIQAFKNINSLENPENLYAWLGAVTYNQGMKIFRKKKDVLLDEEAEGVFDTIVDESIEWSPEETTDKNETANILMDIIDELPPLQKAAIVAFYYDNMKIDEIAEAEGCSANTIKSRLNYAKKYIKSRVEEMQNQGGYKLYSINIPAILLAIWLLSNKASNTLSQQAAGNIYQATKYKLASYVAQRGAQNVSEPNPPLSQPESNPTLSQAQPQQAFSQAQPQQAFSQAQTNGRNQQPPFEKNSQPVNVNAAQSAVKAVKKGATIGKIFAGIGLTAAVATGGVLGYDALTGQPFGLFVEEITKDELDVAVGVYTGTTKYLFVLESTVQLTISHDEDGEMVVNVQLDSGTSVLNETMDKVYVDGDKLRFERTTDVDFYEGYIVIEDEDNVKFYFTISGKEGSAYGSVKVKVCDGVVLEKTE